VTVATLAGCSHPVDVDATTPDAGTTAACQELLDAVPDTVMDQPRRDVSPHDALAAAWGDPAVVLRCGVDKPAAMTPDAQLVEVDGVTWLPEPLSAGYLFTTYGRTAYVEVSVPDDYAPEGRALVDLAAAVTRTVPES